MIYTYDKTTGKVVMVSDAPNIYDNPNWADFEGDEAAFLEWQTREDTSQFLKVEDEAVSLTSE